MATTSEVFSFSAKGKEAELINEIKLKHRRRGRSFSWIVIEALKQYEHAMEVSNEPTKSKN